MSQANTTIVQVISATELREANGPFIVGYTLCFGLMGSLAVQSYIYFTHFPDDRRLMKVLVTVVLLLEELMTAFTFSGFLGSRDMFIFPEASPVSPLFILAPMTGLVTTLTQSFYCWRIWSLRKRCVIPLSIIMLSLVQFGSICILRFSHV